MRGQLLAEFLLDELGGTAVEIAIPKGGRIE
jgi:Flp pilus assembly pilin Flp